MRSYGWTLIQYYWSPSKQRIGQTVWIHKGKIIWGHNEKNGQPQVRKRSFGMKPTTLPPWAWTCNLKTVKKIYFCYLNHLSVVLCYRSPKKLTQIILQWVNWEREHQVGLGNQKFRRCNKIQTGEMLHFLAQFHNYLTQMSIGVHLLYMYIWHGIFLCSWS